MDKNFDNLATILDKCKADMHGAADEEALLQLLDEANSYIEACNNDLSQAKRTIELTEEQLRAVSEAHQESEHRAEAAAIEENDARTALEMAKKMLDDATLADSIANQEAVMILQKAADVLRDTVTNAEEFYHKKAQEKQEADAAAIRLLSTKKAIEYTAAKAYTAEGIRLRDVVLAQLMADVKAGEKEAVSWQHGIDEVRKAKEDGKLAEKISALQESLRVADEKIDLNSIAEEEERSKQRVYLDEQQQTCREQLSSIDAQLQSKTEEKQRNDEELRLAQETVEQLITDRDSADLTAEQVAKEIDGSIASDKEEKAAAFAHLDEGVEQVRQAVAVKKQAYQDAAEKALAAAGSLDDLRQQVAMQQQRIETAKAEEDSAHEAADVARRLVDNAVKVRLSISQESADLLLSAQQALAESASAAEELEQKKYQYRIDLEQKLQELQFAVGEAEKEADAAERDSVFAKAVWENEEAELVKEIENVAQQKNELDNNFEHKVEEYDIRLNTVRSAADKAHAQLVAAQDKVAALEQSLAQIQLDLENIELERTNIERHYEELRDNYLAESQARLDVILSDKRIAQNEAELYSRELKEARSDLAALDARESDLSVKLMEAQSRVESIIETGSEQVLSAEIEVESRQAAEETARQAAEEIVAYIEENDIPAVDYSAIPVFNDASSMPEPADTVMGAEDLAEEVAEEEASDEQLEAAEAESEEYLADEEAEPAEDEMLDADAGVAEADDEAELSEAEDIAIDEEMAAVEEAAEPEIQDELVSELEEEQPQEADHDIDEAADADKLEDTLDDLFEEGLLEDIIEEKTEAAAAESVEEISEPRAEDATAVQETVAEDEPTSDETAALPAEEEPVSAATEPVAETALTEDESEARRRAEEEAEEAAILAGLTGGLSRIDADNTDESAEYTAWLDIISSDMIEKLMNEDETKAAESKQADVDDWIADLEQTFIKEDLALKHNDEGDQQADATGNDSSEESKEHKNKHVGKKNKKNKKPFRFF